MSHFHFDFGERVNEETNESSCYFTYIVNRMRTLNTDYKRYCNNEYKKREDSTVKSAPYSDKKNILYSIWALSSSEANTTNNSCRDIVTPLASLGDFTKRCSGHLTWTCSHRKCHTVLNAMCKLSIVGIDPLPTHDMKRGWCAFRRTTYMLNVRFIVRRLSLVSHPGDSKSKLGLARRPVWEWIVIVVNWIVVVNCGGGIPFSLSFYKSQFGVRLWLGHVN